MKNLKRYTLKRLSIFALPGLILSLTQLAAPARAQTTNRDEIRAKIQQLESDEKALKQDIANDKILIPRLDSDAYVIFETDAGLVVVPRSDLEKRLSVQVHLGKRTPQQAIRMMETFDNARTQFQAVIRRELPQLEQQLTKTHDEISYYLNELARLNEAAASSPKSRSGSSITAQDLTGTTKWETHFRGVVTRDQAEITMAGKELRIRNQVGQTATAHLEGVRIIVTFGWPDSTPAHPVIGTLIRTENEGIKIEWGQLLEGHGSGGFWIKQ